MEHYFKKGLTIMTLLNELTTQAEANGVVEQAINFNYEEYKKQRLEFLDSYSNIAYKPLEPYVNHFYDLFIRKPAVPLERVLNEAIYEVRARKLGTKLLRELDLEHYGYMNFIRSFKNLLAVIPFSDPLIDEDTLRAVCLTMNQKLYPLPFLDFLLPFVGAVIAYHKYHEYLRELTVAYENFHKIPNYKSCDDTYYESPIEPGYYRFNYDHRSFGFAYRLMKNNLDKSLNELLEIDKAQNYETPKSCD